MEAVVDELEQVKRRYAHGHDRPLGAYSVLDAAYLGLVAGIGLLARRRGVRPPRGGMALKDLAVAGLATHRIVRTIAKDPITSPVRAPFTRYEGTSGPAELKEEVQGEGLRHALGELVTCPFCLSQWIGTGFATGLLFAPRATRWVAGGFGIVAVSDMLQYVYAALRRASGESD